MGGRYAYREEILAELVRHGLAPGPNTSPGFLREAVRDLYLFEIRRLRQALLARRIERRHYASHVIELRKRYPVLSIPIESWTSPERESE